MKKVIVLCFVAVAALSSANNEASFRKSVAGLCAATVKAFNNRDTNWFISNSTKDFIYVDASGKKQTKEQSMTGMKQMFQMAKSVKSKVTCGSVKFANGIGRHVNTMVSTIVMTGPDKKPHTMVVTAATEDSFKWDGSKWKFCQVKETKAPTYMLDGKKFNPNNPAPPNR